jgi:CDP-glycerol glycerophosphotransferase
VTLDKRLGAYRSSRFLSHVSEIHPKTKTVVFAGGSYFGDNIKYAYLSFLDKALKAGIGCYFLPYNAAQVKQLKAAGLPCLPFDPAEYTSNEMDICLSAKVLVLDNHFVPLNWRHHLPHSLLRGAKTIQLWHGIPIKEIGLETVTKGKIDDPNVAELVSSCGPFDVFVALSGASRVDWARKFSFRDFSSIGYPRNDVLLRDITPSDKINIDKKAFASAETSSKSKKPVILYAPTFRDYKDSAWFEKAEISALADYCSNKGYLFYVNLHPAEQDSVETYRHRYPTINFVDPHTDIYPLVKCTSVLITDYSSLAFDYLLLDRPVVFYRPDHAEYVARSRHLIKNHDQYICGTISYTPDELKKAVDEAVGSFLKPDIDPYRRTRQVLRQKLFDHSDGLASERLHDVILNLLEAHP